MIANHYPIDPFWFDIVVYLLIGVVVPVALMLLCWLVGRLCRRPRLGRCIGLVAMVLAMLTAIYGFTLGIRGVQVRHVTLAFDDLPDGFDGYRILHISDLHVGSLRGWRAPILAEAIDSALAQQADMIAFTGDLQNARPMEVEQAKEQLRRLRATDGVFSVLGNHDYPVYIDVKDHDRYDSLGLTVMLQTDTLGWTLLNNSHRWLRRGGDSIVVAGMENDGEGRFPCHANLPEALHGVKAHGTFVVMLEHDPTSWRRTVLRRCHAQLTLSGHTHGGQMSLMGWTPASLRYREYSGHYSTHGRHLLVSNGIGGLIPFRLGVKPEITVVTMKGVKR